MFIEQHLSSEKRGWIEVVCGSMFSGKTEELIRRLKRAQIANMKVEVYKPATDTRYDKTKVVSHDANTIASTPVDKAIDILMLAENADVIGIDEAQFFDEEVISVCETLVSQGKRVIVAGLDMDYLGKPFGPMPQLLSIAGFITKLHAICVQCGHLANVSYRTSAEEGTVVLGEKNNYEPRCRICAAK
ncbi:MAG: thymidine kinase [Chitinophagaceae bacterium]